jgi:hypothetical protein
MRAAVAAVAIAAAVGPICGGAQPAGIDPDVRAVLTRYLRFSTTDLADLVRDRIVRHNLDARTPGELGVVGAARVHAPKRAFFAAARDIVHFKTDPGVLQIGRFSDPPTLEDLAPLTVDRADFDPSACRLRDCGIRLPADLIRRVPQEIDLRAPNAQEQAAAWLKRVVLADFTAYLTGGPGRFVQYDDGAAPIRPVEEFEGLLSHAPAVDAIVPGLAGHLARAVTDRLTDAEDFFYWSKEKFGIEPFISITQVTIACPSERTCAMATRDVYSSRYIDASLALSIATDAEPPGGGFYLVYANRSRANALKGGFSALRRSIAERRARGTLEESLKAIKARLESRR